MKKVVLVLVLVLGGCAPQLAALKTAVELGSAGVSNPVTPERLATVEQGAIVVFAGLNAYRRSCMELLLPQSCRKTIASIQVYTRQIPVPLRKLRTFVRQNDQINAVVVYNTLVGLLTDAKAIAAANNVPIGG